MTAQKQTVHKNEHNKEHITLGEKKRQRQTKIYAFSIVKKKQKYNGNRKYTENVKECNTQNNFILIHNRADYVAS